MKMPFGKCTCDNEFLSNWAYVIVFVYKRVYLDNNKKLWVNFFSVLRQPPTFGKRVVMKLTMGASSCTFADNYLFNFIIALLTLSSVIIL